MVVTQPSGLAATLIVLSISIPAVGAAVHGIATQRLSRHHSERSNRMANLLSQLREEMDVARSLEEIQVVARDVEHVMREENNDWFGVVRFHDVELIT